MTTPRARPRTPVHYRVVAYELRAGTETVVIDSTGEGPIAATGTVARTGRMTVEVGSSGPDLIQEQLAQLVADEPRA
jgi:hypothetical protein